MPVWELEVIGVALIVVALALWFFARRNQVSANRWPDAVIIAMAGVTTISLITGIAFIIDGAL